MRHHVLCPHVLAEPGPWRGHQPGPGQPVHHGLRLHPSGQGRHPGGYRRQVSYFYVYLDCPKELLNGKLSWIGGRSESRKKLQIELLPPQVLRHVACPSGGRGGRHACPGRRGDDRAALPGGLRQRRRRAGPGRIVGRGGHRQQGIPNHLLTVPGVPHTLSLAFLNLHFKLIVKYICYCCVRVFVS